jgi:hypothetical protein
VKIGRHIEVLRRSGPIEQAGSHGPAAPRRVAADSAQIRHCRDP